MYKQRWFVLAGVTAAVVSLAVLVAACGDDDDEDVTPTATEVVVDDSAPQTFNVEVGAEDLTEALQMLTFLPADLTINEGDTIVFSHPVAEPHTITFNAPDPLPGAFLPPADGRVQANPELFLASPLPESPPPSPGTPVVLTVTFDGTEYLNSGHFHEVDDVLEVTFTEAGTYDYLCLIHPEHMKGTITVNPAGSPRPKTASEYEVEGDDHGALHETNAQPFFDGLQVPDEVTNPDGSRGFTVLAGATDGENGNDFYRFIGGENLTVRAGDEITWTMEENASDVPHTVTFLSGAEAPGLILREPQPEGPPKLFANPEVGAPAPEPAEPYAGTGYFNSGRLVAGGEGPQSFALTFTEPGTYEYLCLVHDPAGMNGTITVLPP